MIISTEADSPADYAELTGLVTAAATRFTLQRINLAFSPFLTHTAYTYWDACLCDEDDSILFVQAIEGGNMFCLILADGDVAWTSVDTSILATGISGVSVVCPAGDDVARIFYAKAEGLYYIETTDGGATWGAQQTVDASITDLKGVAAVSLTKVHYTVYDDNNTRLNIYENTGSWVDTNSDIYYPDDFSGFDAETSQDDSYDVLVWCAFGFMRYDSQRQGAWSIREQNGRYSDPVELDVIDEYVADSDSRTDIRLSLMNGLLFATYIASDKAHAAACFSRSIDGKHWMHRQPIGGSRTEEGILVNIGDYVHFVASAADYRSRSAVISENSTVEYDVTERNLSYQAGRTLMHTSRHEYSNADDWFSFVMEPSRWQIKEELGYYDEDGNALYQIVALVEADKIGKKAAGSEETVWMTCRDRLAWMGGWAEADNYEEWESQLRHYDDYENTIDPTDDKSVLPYSGLKYVAGINGHWGTEDNELRLKSNNNEGVAWCTRDKFVAHTVNQQAIQVPTADNSEWAGIVFRAVDVDNYWVAEYDEATDAVRIRLKLEGVWQAAAATTGALSWSPAVWYWLRVEARLSHFLVYYSTDGITWTEGIDHVDTTGSISLLPFQEGYAGHAGYGFSDEDIEPGIPLPYVPPVPTEPDEDAFFPNLIVGSRTAGVAFCTRAAYIAGAPTWQLMNTGLDVAGAHWIHCLKVQRVSASERWVYAGTRCGIYRCQLPATASSEWEYRVTTVDLHTATSTVGIGYVYDIIFDWSLAGHAWAKVTTAGGTYWNWVVETWNSFDTITVTGAALSSGYATAGDMAVHRNNSDILLAHGQSGGGGALFKSINGGTTWGAESTDQPWAGSVGWWCYANGGKYVWWQKSNIAPVLYSDDFGATWADALYDGTEVRNIHSNSYDHRSAYLIAYNGVETWNSSTEEFDQFKQNTNMYCQDAKCIQRLSDRITPVYFAMVGGGTNSAESWLASAGALVDRTGNLHTILLPEREGSADDIDCVALNDWYGGEL